MRIRFDSLDEAANWTGTVEEWFHWVAGNGAVLRTDLDLDGKPEEDVWSVYLHLPDYSGLIYIGTVHFVRDDVVTHARAGVRETSQLGSVGPVRTPVDSDT